MTFFFDADPNEDYRNLQNMDIVSNAAHSRFRKKAVIAAANDALLDAVMSAPEIDLGSHRLRCLQCHLGPGFYKKSSSPGTHQHNELQIEIPLSEHFVFTVDGSRLALRPAQALVIPRKTPHNWETPGGFMMGILVSVKDPSGVETDICTANRLKPLVVKNRLVTSHLRQLLDLVFSKRNSSFTPTLCSSLLKLLIGEVLDAVCELPKSPKKQPIALMRTQAIFERTTSFIKCNLKHALDSKALADQTGLSFRQLTRIFVQQCGEAPHAYVLRTRLQSARAIIDTNPSVPLKEVAHDCGFASAPHFTSAFKKSFNLTPSIYAARKASQ